MIIAYTGLPGSGKTYSLAKDCEFERKRRNRDIYANFALKGAHYFSDIKQILNVEHGVIAIDEMNTLCPSSKWQSLPIEYVNLWTQSRKNGIDLWYTTQNFRGVVVSIRDVTNYIIKHDWYFNPKLFSKLHISRKIDAYDSEKTKAKIHEKRVFYENKAVYALYNTKFRIRPPEHLTNADIRDLDPSDLPIFDDNLAIIQENLIYEQERGDLQQNIDDPRTFNGYTGQCGR